MDNNFKYAVRFGRYDDKKDAFFPEYDGMQHTALRHEGMPIGRMLDAPVTHYGKKSGYDINLEPYDKDNNVVHGIVGILPKNDVGNLIKINISYLNKFYYLGINNINHK